MIFESVGGMDDLKWNDPDISQHNYVCRFAKYDQEKLKSEYNMNSNYDTRI